MGRIRKRIKQAKKQARREKQQRNLSLPTKNETSTLNIGKCISLSDREYRVFSIIFMEQEQQIGYLGVYKNGRFRHVLTKDIVDESEILPFLEHYIQEELHLTPTRIYTN